MPQGREKSGRFKKNLRRTPGGSLIRRYEQRLPKIAHCGTCGAKLAGIPRMTRVKARNLTKSKKRPERPYGGVLCTKCMRQKLKEKVR